MKPLKIVLSLLAVTCVIALAVVFIRFFRPAQQRYDWRADPQVWEHHRKELARIYSELGRTPREILAKHPEIERRVVYEGLQTLCSWKSLNKGPLSELEEFVIISTSLGMEVNGGGFHTYFFNSAGDSWSTMLEGMRKAGDERGVARFEKVLGRFPGGRPSKVRAERWKQLESFGEDEFDVFNEDDSAYFDDPFPDWDKVWAYLVEHIDEIQPLEIDPRMHRSESARLMGSR